MRVANDISIGIDRDTVSNREGSDSLSAIGTMGISHNGETAALTTGIPFDVTQPCSRNVSLVLPSLSSPANTYIAAIHWGMVAL